MSPGTLSGEVKSGGKQTGNCSLRASSPPPPPASARYLERYLPDNLLPRLQRASLQPSAAPEASHGPGSGRETLPNAPARTPAEPGPQGPGGGQAPGSSSCPFLSFTNLFRSTTTAPSFSCQTGNWSRFPGGAACCFSESKERGGCRVAARLLLYDGARRRPTLFLPKFPTTAALFPFQLLEHSNPAAEA